jgi:hypothetical protein
MRLSAPAFSIDWTAAIHRCSRPHSNTGGADAGGHHGSRDRPRPQHDAGPCDAPDRVLDVLAVDHGTGLFSARGNEPGYQQRRQCDRKLHFGLLDLEPLGGAIGFACDLHHVAQASFAICRRR